MELTGNLHQLKMAKTKQLFKTVKSKEKLEKNYQRYRAELENLERKYNGFLRPQDIVAEASAFQSPLHDWFDWSDAEAGIKWRLHQARNLMNSITVKVTTGRGFKEYRRYLNVTVNKHNGNKPQRYYVSTKTVLNTESLKQQVLQRAIKEAEYWQRTYEDYQELEEIFRGIQRTKKKLIKNKLLVPEEENI